MMGHPASAAPEPFDALGCPLEGVQLIEASAGTGKTWNICALYLRLLLERGLTVPEVLVVTFTRAATAELKSRIRSRIVEILGALNTGMAATATADPFPAELLAALKQHGIDRERIRQRLDAALQTFDEAAIFTIHGYCQRALTDTPFAAGLPFTLELGENDSELCLEVTQDFWRKHVAGDDIPASLAALLTERGDCPESWAEMLAHVMAHPTARLRWPDAAAGSENLTEALQQAFDNARQCWENAAGYDGRNAIVSVLLENMGGNLKANVYKTETVVEAARGWQQWIDSGDPLLRQTLNIDRLMLFGGKRMVKYLNKNGTAPQHSFFALADDLLHLRSLSDEQLETSRTGLLQRFIEEAPSRLRVIKRQRRRVSFDDILYNVYRALDHGGETWLADELYHRYPAALIDEFQDTDPLQFGIFRRIYLEDSRHGTLFLVGDPKQAIYRFRNADLHTYLYARRLADRHYTLHANQRSGAGLIEACNLLFGSNRHAFVLDALDYESVIEGQKPRKALVDLTGSPQNSALQIWWAPDGTDGTDDNGDEMLTRAELMERSARAVAAEISRLIRAGLAGTMQIGDEPLRPGDIAVLVKTHRQGAKIREALAELGITSVELSQQSVFFSSDAEALLTVLRAIAEPTRQPLLMSALASSLYGEDATALQTLCDDENALVATMMRFVAWRDIWLTRGVAVMLHQWMTEAGIAAHLLARHDGERRLTNLLHLFECLHEAAETHSAPDTLLRWLVARMRPDNLDAMTEAAQQRLESDRNLVQIVTIHRAKGLEYAVTFCPFLWDGLPPRNHSGAAGVIYHEQNSNDGEPELVLDLRADAADDDQIAFTLRRENDAELLRLYYVALTRAIHRCYVIAGGYLKPVGKTFSIRESSRSLLNWLVAGNGMDYRHWLQHTLEAEDIRSAWQRLLSQAGSFIGMTGLPNECGERLPAYATAPDSLRAQTPPTSLPAGWHIGSFSALNRSAFHDRNSDRTDAERDHDAAADADTPIQEVTGSSGEFSMPPEEDDILFFPRGPVAGDCIHVVFERIDFGAPASYDAAITAALSAYPQQHHGIQEKNDVPPLHFRMLHRMLNDVMTTPLHDGIVLAKLPAEQRLVELGFYLPAAQLGADTLNDWLRRHGFTAPRLAFATLLGYLRGFIDLVFQHNGRFYLLDWKSNHLGMTAQNYAPAALETAMQSHGYHLQHLLYSVALHRHLQRTVPDYDPSRHLGGILYLFVRGVRPGWHIEGIPCGVFFQRTPAPHIISLDRLIAQHEGTGETG